MKQKRYEESPAIPVGLAAGGCQNRGVARRELKDYEGAIEDFNQAIRLDPGYARARASLEVVTEELEVQEALAPSAGS